MDSRRSFSLPKQEWKGYSVPSSNQPETPKTEATHHALKGKLHRKEEYGPLEASVMFPSLTWLILRLDDYCLVEPLL